MKHKTRFSRSTWHPLLGALFLLFVMTGQSLGDCYCGGSYPMCWCGAHCTYCEPDCGCGPCWCGNHCTVCEPDCGCAECPCPTCSDCAVCGNCGCGDCPGNCVQEYCEGCPGCDTCTCSPDHHTDVNDCLCDNCNQSMCVPDANGCCINCGCPLPQERWDALGREFEAYKQRTGRADMQYPEYLALQAGYAASECGGSFDEYTAGYVTYENFKAVCVAMGIECTLSMNDYIGMYVESTRDPISVVTGELYFTEEDIALAAPGLPLAFSRRYSSTDGWRHSLDWELKVFDDGETDPRSVRQLSGYETWRGIGSLLFTNNLAEIEEDLKLLLVKTGDGADYRFEMSEAEDGVFYSDAVDWKGICEPIIDGGETNGFRFALHQPGGIVYSFGEDRLESIEDAWGNRIEMAYSSNSLLVAHSSGVSLLLEHEGNPKLPTRAYVSDDLYIDYAYDDAGRLTNTVRHIDGETFEFNYQYDAAGVMTNKTNPRLDGYCFTHSLTNSADSSSVDNHRTTTLEIGDSWMKHQVDAYWGYDVAGAVTNEYRYSDVVYDYGNGSDRKYRYETTNGLVEAAFGPFTNATGVATNRGATYTYEGKNVAVEKTFDDVLGEFFMVHRQYNTNNQVVATGVSYNTTNPVWQTHVAYDPVWRLPASVTNGEGHWTQTLYTNASPLVVKVFWSDTQSFDTTFGYTTNGLLESVTNANGHATCMDYDAKGYLSLVEPPAGPQASTTFNALGYLKRFEVLSESGGSTGRVTEYDVAANGRVEGITHPDGLAEAFLFDKAGNITNAIDRAGRETSYAYAPTEKLTSVTRYLYEGGTGTPVRISYDFDKMFNALSITEPRGRYVESYKLDLQDRVTSVTNIESQGMDIDYGVGNFVKRIDRFDGTAITNSYDAAGRKSTVAYLSATQSPLATIGYSYYADGEIKTISDASSSISNSYDRLNRLTNRSFSSWCSFAANHQYDAVGNITNTVVSANSAPLRGISFSYDEAERLEEISTDDAGVFEYAYDTGNGMVAIVSNTASGITCSYQYDIMDRATNITYRTSDGALIRSFDYEYDAASMIGHKIDFDAATTSTVSTVYIYDSLDRLVYESVSTNGSSMRDVRYSYDLAGNRLSRIENGLKTTYTLGSGNRLASATMQAISNTLFVAGNADELIGTDERWGELWLTNLTSGASVVPSVNGDTFFAEITALSGQTNTLHVAIRDRAGNMGYAVKDYWVGTAGTTNAMQEYAYDAAGCLTNLNGMALDWDERYRLVSANSATSTVSYAYDVLGRRVSRIAGSSTNYFVYAGNQVVADLDGSGTLIRSYVWGPGIDNLLAFTDHTTSNTYYAIKDHQNSVVALVAENGSVVESYEYDAYGNTKVFNASGIEIAGSAFGNSYCFQGREIDWATGLYYFRARWYDPETGRWLSKDLIGISGGLNQYVFCGNNPVNFIDPLGLEYWVSTVYRGEDSTIVSDGNGGIRPYIPEGFGEPGGLDYRITEFHERAHMIDAYMAFAEQGGESLERLQNAIDGQGIKGSPSDMIRTEANAWRLTLCLIQSMLNDPNHHFRQGATDAELKAWEKRAQTQLNHYQGKLKRCSE